MGGMGDGGFRMYDLGWVMILGGFFYFGILCFLFCEAFVECILGRGLAIAFGNRGSFFFTGIHVPWIWDGNLGRVITSFPRVFTFREDPWLLIVKPAGLAYG